MSAALPEGLEDFLDEAGWVLETNKGLNRGMEALGGRICRKYRMYRRTL